MSALEPLEQYRTNEQIYDRIADSITSTREYFLDAPRPEQKVLLNQAVTFALISAQTSVPIHEKGYLGVLQASSRDEIRDALLDAGVNYYKNKARYIAHNVHDADTDRVIDLIESGENLQALRATQEEFMGVGTRKGAYALAKLGVPGMMCIDTHVAQASGIEPDDIYSGVVPEKYVAQCERIEDAFGALRDAVSGRFLFQWVLFDAQRGSVTTHDAWFLSLPGEITKPI